MRSLFLVLSLLIPAVCNAHFIWIEPECEEQRCESKMYFGEYHQAKKETTATRLNERSGLKAWQLGAKEDLVSLPLQKETDHFHARFERAGASAEIVARDEQGAVMDLSKYGMGIVKPVFYARAAVLTDGAKPGPSVPIPAQNLDLVAHQSGSIGVGVQTGFKVLFNGVALNQRAEILIYAPNGWMWEGVLKDGAVAFTPLWPGRYVADVIVVEKKAGVYDGKPYEAIRHRATLSLLAQ